MKTQVIPLDPHDDLISIRDRMGWAKTPRILLVWPKRGRVEVRPLDLTILRRHAAALGAELGIVTRDGEIWAAARELGLPIFSTAARAQKKPWPANPPARLQRRTRQLDLRALRRTLTPPRLLPWLRWPGFRLSIFALGVLAVLVLVLIFIPSAEVNLKLPAQKQSLEIAVSADPEVKTVQLSGLIPARALTLSSAGTATALATGKIPAPDLPASGECLLTNLTGKAVSLPAGTILSTSGTPPILFKTLSPVEVPAKKKKAAPVTVAVRAQAPGTAGNLPAGAINQLEGPLAASVTVTNPAPTSGGTETPLDIPTDQDRESLRKRLLADLEREARNRFPAQIGAGDLLLPATLTRLQVLEESFSPPPGQAGSKVSLTLKVEFGMSYASAADLQELAGLVLDVSLAPGFSPVPGPLEITPVSQLVQSQGRSHWQIRATRSVRAALDTTEVISLVAGKTTRRAAGQLTAAYGLEQPPEIRVSPVWWPWLPFLPMRITVAG
jgi:hypothetical protein